MKEEWRNEKEIQSEKSEEEEEKRASQGTARRGDGEDERKGLFLAG